MVFADASGKAAGRCRCLWAAQGQKQGGFSSPFHPPAEIPESCVGRPFYGALRAFPRVRTPPLWLRPRRVLSLESNGEFPRARTVEVNVNRKCSGCAPLSSAQSMRQRRIPSWGAPGGKDAKRLGASEASEPAGGEAPQEAVLWTRGIRNGGVLE